jgi:putative methyltransferase (TIGR04325 family)
MTAFKARMRSLATDLTPPVALHAAQRLWRRAHGLGWHNFEGSWPTLAEVPAASNNAGEQNDPWAQTLAPEWRANLESRDGASSIVETTGGLLLPLLVAQFAGRLTVLDFAGGAGIGLANILKHARGLDLSHLHYVLVETPAMCRIACAEIESRGGVAVEEIPAALPRPLIVNAGSSLQYIPDYEETIRRLTHLAPEYFIVSYTPVSDCPTYARQVLNAPWRKIAAWVFNRADFIAGMEKCGYRLTFSVDHGQPLTHKNAPGPSAMASMVFSPHHRGAHSDKL